MKRTILLYIGVSCLAALPVHAATTAYGTGFDGTDTVDGTATAAVYASPNAPTDPLDGQNGWGTNNATQTGNYGTSTQLVGRSDYVGTAKNLFAGQGGALGGAYRTTAGTGNTPDVVPSTTTGGIVTLFHAVTIPTAATFVVLDVDFAVTAPKTFTNRDTFGFSLSNAAGTSLVSLNLSPYSANPSSLDQISFTTNGTAHVTPDVIALGGLYHLTLSINTTTGLLSVAVNNATFNGTVNGALGTTQVAATWNLGDKSTISNGGYQNADDNYLVFDNLTMTVPEPSTYAIFVLAVLVGMLRLRLKRA